VTVPVSHVLLTRFNLPSRGHESFVRAKDNWLRDRVQLFERYCLPSVRAQTCQDFSWLVYFDPASPGWLVDWVRGHQAQGHFRPVFREEVPATDLLADIRAAVPDPSRGDLLTTNLDNDDSLADDFVARVQEADGTGPRAAIFIADGLIIRGQHVFGRVDTYNAFCSVRETWAQPVTCWSAWHNLLPQHMPTVVLRGGPGWLQVVHGSNVSNRVRGQRVRPSAYDRQFPGILTGLPEPTAWDFAQDALVGRPARVLRESGRAVAKSTVERLFGRDGLDRAKLIVATARARPR
jgi:hypothetical protein